jgi:hypothetical protein
MNNSAIDLNSAEAKQLIMNLYSFAYELFNKLYKTEINQRGKSVSDYVSDAIEKHLNGTDNYDPERSPLEYHLKKNVIRQAIYNDLPPQRKKQLVNAREDEVLGGHVIHHQNKVSEPSVETYIPGLIEFDNEVITRQFEKHISGDDVLENIFLAVFYDDFDLSERSEICDKYKISPSDFDNGRRRFMTVAKKIFKNLKSN